MAPALTGAREFRAHRVVARPLRVLRRLRRGLRGVVVSACLSVSIEDCAREKRGATSLPARSFSVGRCAKSVAFRPVLPLRAVQFSLIELSVLLRQRAGHQKTALPEGP